MFSGVLNRHKQFIKNLEAAKIAEREESHANALAE